MPITPESFRTDPRRKTTVRCLRGFWVEGRETALEEDEVVELPWSHAVTLIHSNKAVQYDGPVKPGQRVPNPDREKREAQAKLQCPTCGALKSFTTDTGLVANQRSSVGGKSAAA